MVLFWSNKFSVELCNSEELRKLTIQLLYRSFKIHLWGFPKQKIKRVGKISAEKINESAYYAGEKIFRSAHFKPK